MRDVTELADYISTIAEELVEKAVGKWSVLYTDGSNRELPFDGDETYCIKTFDNKDDAEAFALDVLDVISDVYGHNFVSIYDTHSKCIKTFRSEADIKKVVPLAPIFEEIFDAFFPSLKGGQTK